MPRRFSRARIALLPAIAVGVACSSGVAAPAAAQAPSPPSSAGVATSIGVRTTGYEKREGFLSLYVDARQGKLLIELPRDSLRALLLVTQATGLGSNPIGIDRGSGGASYVARFDREGERVLVVFENWRFRSSASGDAAHQRSVAEAFPPSTVAALPLLAQEGGYCDCGEDADDHAYDQKLDKGEPSLASGALVKCPEHLSSLKVRALLPAAPLGPDAVVRIRPA